MNPVTFYGSRPEDESKPRNLSVARLWIGRGEQTTKTLTFLVWENERIPEGSLVCENVEESFYQQFRSLLDRGGNLQIQGRDGTIEMTNAEDRVLVSLVSPSGSSKLVVDRNYLTEGLSLLFPEFTFA